MSQFSDRDAEMERRYLGGETLDELGTAFKITRERVRQIMEKRGAHRPPVRDSEKMKAAHAQRKGDRPFEQLSEKSQAAAALVKGGMHHADAAKQVGMSKAGLYALCVKHKIPMPRRDSETTRLHSSKRAKEMWARRTPAERAAVTAKAQASRAANRQDAP